MRQPIILLMGSKSKPTSGCDDVDGDAGVGSGVVSGFLVLRVIWKSDLAREAARSRPPSMAFCCLFLLVAGLLYGSTMIECGGGWLEWRQENGLLKLLLSGQEMGS